MEQWKAIDGYPRYEISNEGNVRNIKTGRVLKLSNDNLGYKRTYLYANGKRKTVLVHRLVAAAFIPNLESKPEVNHINGKPEDCRAENLEWVTCSENQAHAHNVLRREPSGCFNHRKKVLCDETGVIYASVREAALQTGIKGQSISRVCRGKRKRSGGYHWRYI